MNGEKRRINRIKEVLKTQGRKQVWLADQLGINPNSMTRICSNSAQPHLKDLVKIAYILDVDVRDLLYSTKEEK